MSDEVMNAIAQLSSSLHSRLNAQDTSRSANFRHVHEKIDTVGREVSALSATVESHLEHDNQRFTDVGQKISGQSDAKREAGREQGQWLRTAVTVFFSSVAAFLLNLFLGRTHE